MAPLLGDGKSTSPQLAATVLGAPDSLSVPKPSVTSAKVDARGGIPTVPVPIAIMAGSAVDMAARPGLGMAIVDVSATLARPFPP